MKSLLSSAAETGESPPVTSVFSECKGGPEAPILPFRQMDATHKD